MGLWVLDEGLESLVSVLQAVGLDVMNSSAFSRTFLNAIFHNTPLGMHPWHIEDFASQLLISLKTHFRDSERHLKQSDVINQLTFYFKHKTLNIFCLYQFVSY